MTSYPLVVIGGGPCGATAARSYLDAGGQPPVLVVSSDSERPYWRPPLSKEVLAGQSEPERQPVLTEGEDEIEWRLRSTVSAVDVDARTLQVGDDVIGWEQLVIASGASPQPLADAVPGADQNADVHLLRSLDQARSLTEAASHARSAIVLGSGFIGCEAAASLARRGLAVTLVTDESAPQQNRLGEHAAQAITAFLQEYGVELVTGVEITGVDAPRTVHLSTGRTHNADLVLAALGISPSSDFLDGTGLQLHEGRVVVDDQLKTGVDGVWAGGDVARARHAVAGRNLTVEHWGDALAMGEVAGRGAAGEDARWETPPGFWSQIGDHQLKYSAWGDGHDEVEVVERTGGFTVWYGQGGAVVGVLTYNADDDYERGAQLLNVAPAEAVSVKEAAAGAAAPEPADDDEA